MPDCWSIEYNELGLEGYEDAMDKIDNDEMYDIITEYMTEEFGYEGIACTGYAAEYDKDRIYLEEIEWGEP